MAHQKDGRRKPNFTSYKHHHDKPNDAARKKREREGIARAKRLKALENRTK